MITWIVCLRHFVDFLGRGSSNDPQTAINELLQFIRQSEQTRKFPRLQKGSSSISVSMSPYLSPSLSVFASIFFSLSVFLSLSSSALCVSFPRLLSLLMSPFLSVSLCVCLFSLSDSLAVVPVSLSSSQRPLLSVSLSLVCHTLCLSLYCSLSICCSYLVFPPIVRLSICLFSYLSSYTCSPGRQSLSSCCFTSCVCVCWSEQLSLCLYVCMYAFVFVYVCVYVSICLSWLGRRSTCFCFFTCPS